MHSLIAEHGASDHEPIIEVSQVRLPDQCKDASWDDGREPPIRALSTFAQTALGSVGAAVLIADLPWGTVLSASALAALTSVATSLIATPLGAPATKGTPALVASGSGRRTLSPARSRAATGALS